jgi:uncharacterized membrane protein
MKTTATLLILMCFNVLSVFSQQSLELSIKENSDEPTSKTEHYYLLEVKNTSRQTEIFSIAAQNSVCSDNERSAQVELIQDIFNKDKRTALSSISLRAGESYQFYVKISRPENTKLDKWNCTNISAVSSSRVQLSNAITIKTFIPNPKNFN